MTKKTQSRKERDRSLMRQEKWQTVQRSSQTKLTSSKKFDDQLLVLIEELLDHQRLTLAWGWISFPALTRKKRCWFKPVPSLLTRFTTVKSGLNQPSNKTKMRSTRCLQTSRRFHIPVLNPPTSLPTPPLPKIIPSTSMRLSMRIRNNQVTQMMRPIMLKLMNLIKLMTATENM